MSPEETVRAWVQAQNVALKTGKSKELAKMSADPCKACDDFRVPIEQVYRDGGHFETRGWKIKSLHVRSETGDRDVVEAAVFIAGGRTFLSRGASPVAYPAEVREMEFWLVPQGKRLVVDFVGFRS